MLWAIAFPFHKVLTLGPLLATNHSVVEDALYNILNFSLNHLWQRRRCHCPAVHVCSQEGHMKHSMPLQARRQLQPVGNFAYSSQYLEWPNPLG
jgi:hypothetical protein